MNNYHKTSKRFFWFLVLLLSFGLKAQTVSTYFSFNSNANPFGLATNSIGDLYYVDDMNWPQSINKVDANGIVSTFVSGNYYIQNNNYYSPTPTVMDCDTSDNLYFIDRNTWPPTINKVLPDGSVSAFVNGYYPMSISCDNSGNLYFIDEMNWPRTIKKVDSTGIVTDFFTDSNYNPGSLAIDNSGNLYFIDQMNWPYTINKILPDGSFSTFVSGYNPMGITCDNLDNLYFTDQNSQSINKVLPDGTVSTYVSNGPNMNNPNNLISDNDGNLYFLDNNGSNKIKIILNPANPCTVPLAPSANDASICGGTSANLTASGIGEIQWYDAPTGGNLLWTGNNFSTPVLTSDMTYYVEGLLCASSIRTAVTVTVNSTPIALISGNTTGNDYVALTASGNGTYVWSGGYANTSATNSFTKSGTYSVTVTNPSGCSDTETVTVIVNKFGLNRFGQLVADPLLKVNKNGTINATTYLNKHGKNAPVMIIDQLLNYSVFTAPASHPSNAAEFSIYTDPLNFFSSGSYNPMLLLDWTQWYALNNAGIFIPNNGERFALVVSGFFIPEQTGTYTFTCEGDDAVDLFINNVNVAWHYGGHGTAVLGSHTGTINLVAGTKYVFRARQQENGGGEGLRVFWRRPSETSGWKIYPSELSSE